MVDSSNIKEYLPHLVAGGLAVVASAALVYKLRQSNSEDIVQEPEEIAQNLLT